MAKGWFFKSFLLLILFPPLTISIPDSDALLELKKHFNNATPLDSWVPGSSPCNAQTPNWGGLLCYKGFVIGLRLDNLNLTGNINVDALVGIKRLRLLSVMNNSFEGIIPELNRLVALKALFLSGNQFSGDIPSYYFMKMVSLKRVWLSHNKFTGSIPLSLGQLPSLIELHLENNQFNGHIPAFGGSNLGFINVSNNKLEGEIPASLSKFNATSFEGNRGLCGEKLGVECSKLSSIPNNNVSKPKKKLSRKYLAAIIVLIVMFIIMIILVLIRWMKNKKKGHNGPATAKARSNEPIEVKVSVPSVKEVDVNTKSSESSSSKGYTNATTTSGGGGSGGRACDAAELVMVNEEKGVFGLPDLMKSAAEVLGSGGLGSSYKVMMTNGVGVVVKRMKDMNALGKDEFDKEVKRLGKLKHPNVLTPLAYHYRKEEKLFVYEYLPNGSLLYQLHGDESHANGLDWPSRLKIVQGIARGLDYLHMELSSLDVPHGNLKSSNILLGPDNHPFLSDYGFHPFVNTEAVEALFSYKTPDVIQHQKVTPKSDVYCLGIVILEILTGHFPSQYLSFEEGGTDVVEWAASTFSEGRLVELLDPEITEGKNSSLGNMERLLHIGLLCTESSPEIRLAMKEAIRMIEEIQV